MVGQEVLLDPGSFRSTARTCFGPTHDPELCLVPGYWVGTGPGGSPMAPRESQEMPRASPSAGSAGVSTSPHLGKQKPPPAGSEVSLSHSCLAWTGRDSLYRVSNLIVNSETLLIRTRISF